MRFYCNKASNMLLVLKDVYFVHVNRKANQMADKIEREGLSMTGKCGGVALEQCQCVNGHIFSSDVVY